MTAFPCLLNKGLNHFPAVFTASFHLTSDPQTTVSPARLKTSKSDILSSFSVSAPLNFSLACLIFSSRTKMSQWQWSLVTSCYRVKSRQARCDDLFPSSSDFSAVKECLWPPEEAVIEITLHVPPELLLLLLLLLWLTHKRKC